jgi:hypothetical protein
LNPENLTYRDLLRSRFDIFVRHVWKHVLDLPAPTRVQLDIADYLAHGPNRRVVEAYRGVGKSFLTCAYAVWKLWNDPQKKVLIVASGEAGAIGNANLIKQIIEHPAGDDLWAELRPKLGQRMSTLAFDVGPALPDRQPSVSCLGIGGRLAGNRADILIPDDVEQQNNSGTEDQRDKLRRGLSEFGKILKTTADAEIIYLGTPQTAESIYNDLSKRGYDVRVWPARYPLPNKIANYGSTLAPMITGDIAKDPTLCEPKGFSILGGASVDPDRFTEHKLQATELDGTSAEFMLHMMLDTAMSDAERYPLKLSDLIVMDVDAAQAPVSIAYASSPEYQIGDLPAVGFTGDRFYRPFKTSEHWAPFTGAALHIDPAGSGADETAYVVTKFLHGRIFVRKWGGFSNGTSEATLEKLAEIARDEKVNVVVVEDNWGDGMFRQLLAPVLARKHPCRLEGVKVSGQKEKRIIGSLEPIMKQHRLVMDIAMIREDLKADASYRGLYQMTRITAQRGALKHDDRIDVLAQAAEYWKAHMAVDTQKSEAQHIEKLNREFEERFFAGTIVGGLLNSGNRPNRGQGRSRR